MELEQRGKDKMLEMVRNIVPSHVSCVFIRQAMALGLGHAVLCAHPVVGDEPFAVVLADDLIDDGERGVLKQMVDVFTEHGRSVIGTELVPPEETNSYGVVDPEGDGKIVKMKGIVEKPNPADAPSNRAVVGRYILTPEIFKYLKQTGRGAGGEIQLTDAIASLIDEQAVMAYEFEGKRYDCGSKLGYLQATVDYAINHHHLGEEFSSWLKGKYA
jgi:UTP--glucose-1-phosphate uridylyltransferase